MIILRSIYIYILLILILSVGFYINITYIFSETEKKSTFTNHNHEIDEAVKHYYSGSTLSWDDLVKDCGSYVMTENSARANEIFNRRYFKRIVTWKGYFLSAFVQTQNPMDFNPDHLMNINIRMIPSESLHNPDLFLSLDYKKYQAFGGFIRTLTTGSPVLFKASLEALGNEWRSHHLHLISIERTDDFVDHNKVLLFKGVNFNITGHLKNEEEIKEILKLDSADSNKLENTAQVEINHTDSHSNETTIVNNNSTIEEHPHLEQLEHNESNILNNTEISENKTNN